MIHENIKHFRKAKGLSQEELAVKLHVVRQTVSKWENGLSVPDADVLIRLANVLGVSVSQLLGIETEPNNHQALADQLAGLNEQLALKISKKEIVFRLAEKRYYFISYILSHAGCIDCKKRTGVSPVNRYVHDQRSHHFVS